MMASDLVNDTVDGVFDNVTRTVNFTCWPDHQYADGSTDLSVDCYDDDVMATVDVIETEAMCYCKQNTRL